MTQNTKNTETQVCDEDETFRILTRTPYNEMRIISDNWVASVSIEYSFTSDGRRDEVNLLNSNGWTVDEYVRELFKELGRERG